MMSTLFSNMTAGPPSLKALNADFVLGLDWGILVSLLVVFLIVLLVWVHRRRGHSRGVLIAEDAGNLFITVAAVREFAAGIVAGFGDASLNSVTLSEAHGGYVLTLALDLLPETAVVPLRDQLRERIVKEAAERLGIQGPLKVNFIVRSLSANERRIAKASKKSLGRAPVSPDADTAAPEDETEVDANGD